MHGNRRIAQHRFRPGRRNNNKSGAASDRIFDVPELPLPFLVNHFQIAQRRQTTRAPVNNVVRAINESLFVQSHKHFAHDARKLRRQGESLARPIAALPDLLHLRGDFSAAFRLPLQDSLLEFLAAQLAIVDALVRKLLHHHSLRGDSCVVGSRKI